MSQIIPRVKSMPVLLLLLCTFVQLNSFSQTPYQQKINSDPRIEKAVFNNKTGQLSLLRFKEGNITEKDIPAALRSFFNMANGEEIRKLSSAQDKAGITVTKYRQYYHGIPVEHGIINLVSKASFAEALSGVYYDLKNINTNPSLTESAALAAALQFVHAEKYAWEQAKEAADAETDPLRKQLYTQQYEHFYPAGSMVIVKDISRPGILDLAYKFDIYAAAPLSRGYVYVSAHTGKILLYDKIIKHLNPDQHKTAVVKAIIPELAATASTPLTASQQPLQSNSVLTPLPTRYAGIRMAGTKQVSGNDPSGNGLLLVSSTTTPFIPGSAAYVLIDDTHHSQSEQTYDLNGAGGLPVSVPVYGTAKSFTDVDNNWTLTEHNRGGQNNEAENDDYVFDAHWGATVVYDYWKNIHNRLSFDNNNSSIKSYAHYGAAYDNAFWNGEVMTYGDGSSQGGLQAGFAPLTSLDVCGHEIGHGVCSFTADLVYQGESGAMNEGFSDVWAACIENYALQHIDPSLAASASNANGFKVWSIGEQIDANDIVGGGATGPNYPSNDPNSTALRYMDNPNLAGDPASYAEKAYSGSSRRWADPNCTAPNLVNDECGVHTNSGVLNRLMYVLTMGASGTVNTEMSENTSGAVDGAPYNVTGVGFARSEKIMYLTEQMLSPNATFLDARNAGVTAAEILYGKCSYEWKQTIIAWNAVAVGPSSDTAICALLPPFSVSVQRNVDEATAKSAVNCSDASVSTDLIMNMLSPGISSPVTVTVTTSGTATLNRDYTFPVNSVTYNANESGIKKLNISVYNDAETESDEDIILNVHATDGAGFTKDTTITITIKDDDNAPMIGSGRTILLTENFDGTATGALPAGWNAIDKLGGASTVNWRTGPAYPAANFTTKTAMVSLNAAAGGGVVLPAYDPSAPGNVLLSTPQVNAKSYNDLMLTFTYAANGEVDASVPPAPLDYGRLVYSYDGVNFQPLQYNPKFYYLSPTAKRDTVALPSFLNNKQFYLGFEWYNDDNLALSPSFMIDSVVLTGGRQKIETEAGEAVAEKQFAGKDIYYMSAEDGELIARIQNNSADLGCVTASLEEAGNGASGTTFTYGSTVYQRAKKVFSITPSPANSTASYDITLYATTGEMAGMTPGSVQVVKVKDGVPLSGTINAADAVIGTTVFEDHSSDGYYTYKASFTGFSQFLLALPSVVVAQRLLDFTAAGMYNRFIRVSWSAANESSGDYVLERAEKNSNVFVPVNTQFMQGANQSFYSFDDYDVKQGVVYQYRLRIRENNTTRYSPVKLASLSGNIYDVTIAPNPSEGLFNIYVQGMAGDAQVTVYDGAGRQIITRKQRIDPGISFPVNLTGHAAGVYTLKLVTAYSTGTYKLVVR